MTDLSYNQFRASLKGTPQKEISQAWKLYKKGEYPVLSEEPPVVEAPAPKKAAPKKTAPKKAAPKKAAPKKAAPKKAAPKKAAKEVKDKLALCTIFLSATEELARKPWLFSEVEKKKVLDKLLQIAQNTIPKEYTCSPSDSWKLWFGPTSECLLINTTNQMAFKITRTWWQREYNNTIYVDRELLKDNKLIELEKMRYARMGKYVPRNPVPGIECKLPQGVKDITVHGGQAGGR